MFVAYCYKLKPSHKQAQKMTNWLNMLRANYNFSLRDRIEAYEQARSPILGNYSRLDIRSECCPLTCSVSQNATIGNPWKNNGKKRNAYEQQSSNLPLLKAERPWYKTIHSTVLQQNLKRLHKAFDNFFEGKGYPKFKNQSKFRSFSYTPGQVKVNNNAVYLPGIGWMTYFNSRAIPQGFKIKTVTVRCKADGWYVSFRLEDKIIPDVPKIELSQVKAAIAGDLGIHFVEVDPKNSSRQCRKCGYIDQKNRNKERFFCLQCFHLEDADNQAAKLLLNRGLKQLGISEGLWAELGSAPCKPRPNQLLAVRQKVTAQEISLGLPDEPSNPNKVKQLSLFDFDLWSANLVIN